MANDFVTLLELTKLKGTDTTLGIVEEVTTFAPELDTIRGREISGVSNLVAVRTALPTGPAFRSANEGVNIGKATHQQKRFDTFFFDGQMQVDESIVRAAVAQGGNAANILNSEAVAIMRAKTIAMGSQLYAAGDSKGFPALSSLLDAAMDVDAGGSGTTYTAWFLWNAPGGLEFIFSDGGIREGQWTKQQVVDPNDSAKRLMAWVNNLSGYIGVQCPASFAIGRVKNISSAKPLTDDLGEDLIALFPVGQRPNLCFVNRQTRRWLQKSRSVTVMANVGSRSTSGAFQATAPQPTDCAGVPLVVTDSITS